MALGKIDREIDHGSCYGEDLEARTAILNELAEGAIPLLQADASRRSLLGRESSSDLS
jgi:hypothetical protein